MKKPLQNILAVAGSDIVSRLLGFVTTAYVARVLGTSSFGVMSVGLSVLGYAILISSPGLHVSGTRLVAATKARLDEYASSVNSLRFALACICCAVIGTVAMLWVQPGAMRFTTLLFALSAIPAALSLDWYFQGKENLVLSSGSKIVVAGVYLLFVVVAVDNEADVMWTAVGLLVANIVSAGWLLAMFRGLGNRFVFSLHIPEWKGLIRRSLPFGISSLLAQTIVNAPVLIIAALVSSHDAGVLNAAMKLIVVVMIIDRVFYAMFFPVVSRQRAMDTAQFRRTASIALRVVLSVAIPVAVAGIVFAAEAIHIVYGPEFAGAVIPLQILLLYFLFSVLNTVLMAVMIADNREREYLRIMAVATLLLVGLCVALSFIIGIHGAAISVAMGEGVMMVRLFAGERKSLFTRLARLVAPALISGAVMLGVLLWVQSWSMAAALSLGMMSFLVALVALGGVSKEELVFLRERFI